MMSHKYWICALLLVSSLCAPEGVWVTASSSVIDVDIPVPTVHVVHPGPGELIEVSDDLTAIIKLTTGGFNVPSDGFVNVTLDMALSKSFYSPDIIEHLVISVSPGTHTVEAGLVMHNGEVVATSKRIVFEVIPNSIRRVYPPSELPREPYQAHSYTGIGVSIIDELPVFFNQPPVRVLFIGDLHEKLDGAKVWWIQQLEYLPPHIHREYLDLTCNEHPAQWMMAKLRQHAVRLSRMCVDLPPDLCSSIYPYIGREGECIMHIAAELRRHDTLVSLPSQWLDRFAGLLALLTRFDAVVVINGDCESDAYVFELARLAGVQIRLLDLIANLKVCHEGAFTGVVAASHYAMTHPLVAPTAAPVFVIRPAHSLAEDPDTDAAGGSGEILDGGDVTVCEGRVTVAFIGRLAPEKNPGMFIRSAALLAPLYPDAAFVVAGDGPLRVALEELADELLLVRNDTTDSERCGCGSIGGGACSAAPLRFVGWVGHERMRRFLKKIDILVLPSLFQDSETFGIINVEAMRMGIPVVNFGIGGTLEYTRHLKTGIVVEDVSVAGLAEGVAVLLRDPALRERLGRAAAEVALDEFSATRLGDSFGRLYWSLAKGGRALSSIATAAAAGVGKSVVQDDL